MPLDEQLPPNGSRAVPCSNSSYLEETFDNEDGLSDYQWVEHSKRPGWEDVVPVSINELESTKRPIVEIAYSVAFKDTYDYLRALIAKGEMSPRAYYLTEEAVTLNPASYTAWHYRRQIVKKLDVDLEFELNFISRLIAENPKNYQVWEHRRAIVEWKNDFSKEAEFLDFIVDKDSKNYHAWQYRQWMVEHFNMFNQSELDYTLVMIGKDVRNNSAWNHRFFLLRNCANAKGGQERIRGLESRDVKLREMSLCFEHLGNYCMNNESAWNYLRGLIDSESYSTLPQVVAFCDEQYSKGKREVFLLEMQLEIRAEQIRNVSDGDTTKKDELIREFDELAKELLELDQIRCSYWKWFLDGLRESFRDAEQPARE